MSSYEVGRVRRVILVCAGVFVNVLLSYLMNGLGLPLFLDTTGTITVTVLCGLVPGIFVAILTNIFCLTFNPYAMYFAFINAFIAVFTGYFTSRYSLKKLSRFILFVLSLSLFAGIVSSLVQWLLFNGPQHNLLSEMAAGISGASEMSLFNAFLITNIFLNVLDKGITALIVLGLLFIIPQKFIDSLRAVDWRQRPLSDEEKTAIKKWKKNVSHSLESRIYFTLIIVCVWLVIIIGVVGYKLFYDNESAERTECAWNAARFTADLIDGDMIEEYLRLGKDAPGYTEIEETMYKIRDSVGGIKYLYAHTIDSKDCVFVFDLTALDGEPGYEPGEVVPVEETFEPYLEDFRNGKEVGPLVSNSIWKRVITVYVPVVNSE